MATTETPASTAKSSRKIPAWVEIPIVIVAAIFLAFLIKTFIVQIFYIPSGSMENTLLVGDRVAVNRFTYRFSQPQRGDIVVFDGVDSFVPAGHKNKSNGPVGDLLTELGRTVGVVAPPDTVFVKRVIGVGGDRVKCCNAKGQIMINGEPIAESQYLFPKNVPSETKFDVVVPEGKLWVLGDHRGASADSRAHMGEPGGGFVPTDRVLGKAFAIIWPLSRAQLLSTPQWAEQMNSG
ncbi:MAG: signal peptidase I [Candidatus Nanopelagicales bacterium]|nr:signal peptidase I [Candidatus Nanopelagicales bacterium]